ncbi:hypothetical protein D3C76_1789670 [compost metagenome]
MFDFALTLNVVQPDSEPKEQAVVYLSPQHAKALLQVLSENVTLYESVYGKINLDVDPDRVESLISEGKIKAVEGTVV